MKFRSGEAFTYEIAQSRVILAPSFKYHLIISLGAIKFAAFQLHINCGANQFIIQA